VLEDAGYRFAHAEAGLALADVVGSLSPTRGSAAEGAARLG
jgi:hypothetical protein